MATDVQNLKPSELLRILNGTPLGPVLDDRTLRRHRQTAGTRLGSDAKRISLLSYFAWLFERTRDVSPPDVAGEAGPAPSVPPTRLKRPALDDASRYELLKERARERNAEASAAGRDIGELPPVADPARKKACERDLLLFCRTYDPGNSAPKFYLPFSKDHFEAIELLQRTVLEGGLFAFAMPRGSGKSTLTEFAILWGLLFGHVKLAVLMAANAEKAAERMANIQAMLLENDLLAEDFPEVVQAIRHLEGDNRRSKGQTYQGRRTGIKWSGDEIVLPDLPGSPAAGSIAVVAGIRSAKIRGTNRKGRRPDIVMIDDPQTDESAKSTLQCARREKTIEGAVLGMSGPGRRIAAVMPCTVIERGDMADRFLDPRTKPRWRGKKAKLLYAFPKRMDLWDEYKSIRDRSFGEVGDASKATAFYKKNRKAMDEGAVVAWPERFEEDQVSALQYAMDLFFADDGVFAAEYQNEPLEPTAQTIEIPDDKVIERKVHGYRRNVLPEHTQRVTVGIDVQSRVLYWTAIAWRSGFEGFVLDYGTWPRIDKRYFTYRQVELPDSYQFWTDPATGKKHKLSVDAALMRAIEDCTDWLAGLRYETPGGATLPINRIVLDYGYKGGKVLEACRQSKNLGLLIPAIGRTPKAGNRPLMEWKLDEGMVRGDHYIFGRHRGSAGVQTLMIDVNYWKTFLQERLRTQLHEPGSLSLFDPERGTHRMFAEHLASERPTEIERDGRRSVIWELLPGRDNHWLDAAVYACVAESTLGGKLAVPTVSPTAGAPPAKPGPAAPAKRGKKKPKYFD